jgi:hypothetical protein
MWVRHLTEAYSTTHFHCIVVELLFFTLLWGWIHFRPQTWVLLIPSPVNWASSQNKICHALIIRHLTNYKIPTVRYDPQAPNKNPLHMLCVHALMLWRSPYSRLWNKKTPGSLSCTNIRAVFYHMNIVCFFGRILLGHSARIETQGNEMLPRNLWLM